MHKTEIMALAKAHCNFQKWKYKEGEDVIYTGFCVIPRGEQYRTTILIRDDGLLVYVYVPRTENCMRNEKFESLICRLNEGLVNGNFECVKNSPLVRYKVYMNCVGLGDRFGDVLQESIELAIKMVLLKQELIVKT